ncbi:MAG TPA: DUF4249 family protein [Ignavibacteriaceae bacterium]|nr:DUF4249 family protein [Ignavibacteriaceae bacterium]
MKKRLLLSLVILASLSILSCEEEFNPKIDFQEKYILYSIINPDSSFQTAVLLKTYDVPGYDPYINSADPSVKDATILLVQNDRAFFLRDTVISREDTSRYNAQQFFYYTNDFEINGDDSLQIVAVLPSGKTLSALTKLPESVTFDTSSDHLLPVEDQQYFQFIWDGPVSSRWYLPKLTFYYLVDGIRYGKDIPITYSNENGNWVPEYPGVTNTNTVRFEMTSLDSVFRQISEGDEDKSHYIILGAVLSLLVFDEELSRYYSTTNGFLDDFTVKLDETDYTNIDGGFGIFASFVRSQTGAVFNETFIKSFGYTPGLP